MYMHACRTFKVVVHNAPLISDQLCQQNGEVDDDKEPTYPEHHLQRGTRGRGGGRGGGGRKSDHMYRYVGRRGSSRYMEEEGEGRRGEGGPCVIMMHSSRYVGRRGSSRYVGGGAVAGTWGGGAVAGTWGGGAEAGTWEEGEGRRGERKREG